jgi:hypothetical protein
MGRVMWGDEESTTLLDSVTHLFSPSLRMQTVHYRPADVDHHFLPSHLFEHQTNRVDVRGKLLSISRPAGPAGATRRCEGTPHRLAPF